MVGVMGDVRLVDLDVIKRYSLAVREEWVDAEELLGVLDASRDEVLAAMGGSRSTRPARPAGSTRAAKSARQPAPKAATTRSRKTSR